MNKLLITLLLTSTYTFTFNSNSKIYVAGHRGLVGSAIVKRLKQEGHNNIIVRTSKEVDLRNPGEVEQFFAKEKPEYVFLAAAKVGGIQANMDHPAQFIYDNLAIEMNVIHAAHKHGVKKLLFLGSSCIYPRNCPQPIKEEYLLTQPLEKTNEWYAIAKIAGLKLCQAYNKEYGTNFITCMPTNLYGPGDNFDLKASHVLPALIRKFYEAKINNKPFVSVWGDGSACREFLHVDDLADATIHLIKNYNGNTPINIGSGKDISIKNLALMIQKEVGYSGKIIFDKNKPNGTPKKLLDVSLAKEIGWQAKIKLYKGIQDTILWYINAAK